MSNDSQDLQALQEVVSPEPAVIPFELYDKQYRKTTKLADLDSGGGTKGRSDWFEFQLSEPVFVSSIVVQATDYSYRDCEFQWEIASTGRLVETKSRFESDQFEIEIRDFISSFKFRPDKKYWGKPWINSVRAIGFTQDAFLEARASIVEIDDYKRKAVTSAIKTISRADELQLQIAEMESQRDAVEEAIEELDEETEEKKDAKERLETEIGNFNKVISERKAEQSALEARLEKQSDTIQQRQAERDGLAREIEERGRRLRELENDIDLFPSELGEFARKSSEHKAFYWKLAALPILVVTVMTGMLLFDAHKLVGVGRTASVQEVASIFFTRIPYVVVAGTILGVMFKIAQSLITEIMRIDNQNRALAKVSIVATDVHNASSDGLELTDEENYHLRTGLKMDLLRDHLKTYVSDKFDYLKSERVKSKLVQLRKPKEAQAEDNDSAEE